MASRRFSKLVRVATTKDESIEMARAVFSNLDDNEGVRSQLERYDAVKDCPDRSTIVQNGLVCGACGITYRKIGRVYGFCSTCLGVYDSEFAPEEG